MQTITIRQLKTIVENINNDRVDIQMVDISNSYSFTLKEQRKEIFIFCNNYKDNFTYNLFKVGANIDDFKYKLENHINEILNQPNQCKQQ